MLKKNRNTNLVVERIRKNIDRRLFLDRITGWINVVFHDFIIMVVIISIPRRPALFQPLKSQFSVKLSVN